MSVVKQSKLNKKKNVCLRPQERSQNIYDVRNYIVIAKIRNKYFGLKSKNSVYCNSIFCFPLLNRY
jgi:hypothetical protein